MEIIIKHFNDLTKEELVEIYKLRVSVFVVEQHCPYQEIDDYDHCSYHIYIKEEGKIIAYCRVLPKGCIFKEASIGRVISIKRRCGIATRLVKEGIKVAKEKFDEDTLKIEAQVYARGLYEKCGFYQVSDPFLEDGILHIQMRYQKKD